MITRNSFATSRQDYLGSITWGSPQGWGYVPQSKSALQQGWICPRCEKVHAPQIPGCDCIEDESNT